MWSKWREGDTTKSLENKPGSSFCTVKHRALLFPETSGVLLVFGQGCKESPDPSPQPNHRDSTFSVFKRCDNNGNLLLKVPCTQCYTQWPQPCNRPPPTHASSRDSWILPGKSGSVSYGVTAPFSWVLVCTGFCLCPPRVCFPSPV